MFYNMDNEMNRNRSIDIIIYAILGLREHPLDHCTLNAETHSLLKNTD